MIETIDQGDSSEFHLTLEAVIVIIFVGLLLCCCGCGLVCWIQRRNKKKLAEEEEASRKNQERASAYRTAEPLEMSSQQKVNDQDGQNISPAINSDNKFANPFSDDEKAKAQTNQHAELEESSDLDK